MKHYEKLKQLLDEELDGTEYSFDLKFEEEKNGQESYCAYILISGKYLNEIELKATFSAIYVLDSDFKYQKVKPKDYSIKYFWIALLS